MSFLLLIEESVFKLGGGGGGGMSLTMTVLCVFSLFCSYNMEKRKENTLRLSKDFLNGADRATRLEYAKHGSRFKQKKLVPS